MSYDIYFLRREPGQSWQQALEVMEGDAAGPLTEASRPACWDQVVSGVQEILGSVSVEEGPHSWEIDDPERTAIQVSCFSGKDWSLSVPYWSSGDKAKRIAESLRAIAMVITDATGLDAYDPQLEAAVTSGEWSPVKSAAIFDCVAESFDRRGIQHG